MSKRISVDNGRAFASEAVAKVPWDTIVNLMDDETRERVHEELAPCTNEEFLTRYLELARAGVGRVATRVTLNVRATDAEIKRWRRAARADQRTLSDWVRLTLDEVAKRAPGEAE